MPRVFLLLSDGGPTGAATQARLALGSMPRVESETATTTVRTALDFRPLSAIRDRVAAFRPDVVHAVGAGAARTAALLTRPRRGLSRYPRLVVSGCDAPDGWLARRGLARADAVLAYSPGEADRYRALVRPGRIHLAPPGVRSSDAPGKIRRPPLDLPSDAVVIAAVGNFDRRSGLRTAVWAFDVLKYVNPALRLLLIGDGPGRAAVDRFGRSLGFDDYRVAFAGRRDDVPDLLAATDVVWVTHDRGGVTVALEAMAAGVPVVAFRTADTQAVVSAGETGVLVPPGDRVALASATADLLARPAAGVRLGGAAARAAAQFSVGALAAATAVAYDCPS